MNDLFFKEPRLSLTTAGDFFVRLVTYISYVILTASVVTLLFSGVGPIRTFGILLALFLIDRLIHFGQAEKNLSELGGKNKNLVEAVTPAAHRILSHAFRESYLVGENLYLLILRELVERKDIKEILRRLDVKTDDFGKKIRDVAGQEKSQIPTTTITIITIKM